MRKFAVTIICLLLTVALAGGQEKKILNGFDGGAMTALLMMENPSSAWEPIDGTIYHRQGFMAIDPFIGCDFIVSKPMHLTLKVDYLCALSNSKLLPHGPRVYFGFLFYH